MKRIAKTNAPAMLTQWLRKQNGHNCSYDRNLPGDVRNAIQLKLLSDQGWICCYTGQRVSMEDSHIEHVYPQTRCREEAIKIKRLQGAECDVDYKNMLASCGKRREGVGEAACPFGAKPRGSWWSDHDFIHPLRPDCEAQFRYLTTGKIEPADNERYGPAAITIDKLCLNHEILDQRRLASIRAFLYDENVPLSKAQLERLRGRLYDRDDQGRFKPFCFVLVQACDDLLHRAHREHTRREAIRSQQKQR